MTIRLAGVVIEKWPEFDGWVVGQGLPEIPTLPLGRFSSLVWHWLTRNAESEQDVQKIRATLWRPPPGQVADKGPWSPEAEAGAFQALKKSLVK